MTGIVVMGVSASGKTQVGTSLAETLGLEFIDGDDLHPAANVAKMTAGEPLTDGDRLPWLDAVGNVLARREVVLACSALKASYRAHLRSRAGRPIRFLHLDVSEPELRRRIEARHDHFMPASLLRDQLATLEWPGAEADVTVVPGDQSLAATVAAAVEALSSEGPPPR